ncbi:MAG TPA: efflux RND transporter permease subunit [Bacteroidia bacterium]|nr:efflux RND transporter permease subunit [Bacteroidia bacterium]
MSTQEDNKKYKEFGPSSFSISNATSIYVLVLIIVIVGLVGYRAMPKESFPEIKQSIIYIGTVYPGNSPEDMENLVTRTIEKEIKGLKGLKKFTSTSIQDYSTIIVEFELDVPVEEALQDVKDAVDKIKNDLPNDLPNDPNIFEMDFSEFPVLNVNISGNFNYDVLKENAEYLQDEFEKLPEISSADLRGLLDKEVRISVDKNQMEALQISFQDIENAVAAENVTISGGEILSIEGDNMNRRSIRVTGEFKDFRKMGNIIVKDENQQVVYLRDIATVEFAPEEPTSFARLDGYPVVSIDIKKKSGENLLNGVDKVREVLEKAKKSKLPPGMSVVLTNDQSVMTRDNVNNLENSIISGVILVVLVLLFFMGVRNAMFVGIAIPLSMLLGYAILYFMGASLNMMVLFSLIMALGMLVDNGIVVVENIYRLYSEEGMNKLDASKYGIGEVAVPIISSTLTTLAAFFPLLFWDDLMGEFMKYMPITLIIVLSSSLFVALIVNPVLTSKFIQKEGEETNSPVRKFWAINAVLGVLGLLLAIASPNKTIGNLMLLVVIVRVLTRYYFKPASARFQRNGLVKIENFYGRVIRWALKRGGWLVGGTFFLLIFSFMFFGASNPKILFFPENEPMYFNVFIETPSGTDIEKTNAITKKIEGIVMKTIHNDSAILEAVLAQVGEGTADPNSGPQQGASPNRARVTVSFIKTEDRMKVDDARKTSLVMEDVRAALKEVPDAIITVEKNQEGPPVGKPINIEISGENYDTLIKYTNEIKAFLNKADVPGVDKLQTDLETDKPELIVKIDRDAARRFGVSTFAIANTIRTGSFGKEISKFKEGDDDFPINLRLRNQERYNESDLLNQRITFRNPSNGQISQVPISAVARVEYNTTFASIKRKDMDRVITIFSNVKEGYAPNEIIDRYKSLMEDYKLPEGYEFKFTGEQEEQSKSSAFLGRAFMIAFLLIFLIIVAQFNSISGPVIIMASVIFSTIGVFLGFAIFRMDFVILMCGIGIISLAGIAVNNAIVLIDYTNLLRHRRKDELGIDQNAYLPLEDLREVIMTAGTTRLRPVLLTAITTILGLVPLALGININFFTLLSEYDAQYYTGGDSAAFWGPMSWTIIFGLIFTTFLTLVVVPVMFYLTERFKRWVKGIKPAAVKTEIEAETY